MNLDAAVRRMLPPALYEEPPPRAARGLPVTHLRADEERVTRPRRRAGCALLGPCEDGWVAHHGERPARCPDACSRFDPIGSGS